MDKYKISVSQFFVLAMLFTIGTTILVIPSGLAAATEQDAWISAILGIGLNLIVVWFFILLSSRFGDGNLISYCEQVAGKWLGKPIALIFALYSFLGAATVLFYMGNFVTSEVMPETPIETVNLLFAAIVVMGIRLGIETLARTAELLFPWVIITFMLLVAFLLPQVELDNIMPIFEAEAKAHIKAALSVAGTASIPFVTILMIFPKQVNHRRKGNKAFIIATLAGGLVFGLITFLCITVLGADLTEDHVFPSYALAKKVNIGDFIQRIEILIAAIWFITVYYKVSLYFYGFIAGLAQICNLKDYRPLVMPSGLLLVIYSLIVYPNVVYMTKYDSTVYIPYVMTIGLLLPALLLLIDAVRKRVGR